MGSIANIVVNDGTVNRTFAPAKTSADQAFWEDRSATSYVGFNKLTMSLRRPTGPSNGNNRNLKLEVKLETPILESAAGDTSDGYAPAAKVAYRLVATASFDLPERCTKAERTALSTMFVLALSNQNYVDAILDYAIPY